jgi:hypothetical protein
MHHSKSTSATSGGSRGFRDRTIDFADEKLINESARWVTGIFKSKLMVLLPKKAGLRQAITLFNNQRR